MILKGDAVYTCRECGRLLTIRDLQSHAIEHDLDARVTTIPVTYRSFLKKTPDADGASQ